MSGKINIYTDGSSLGNPGPGGYGIIMEWEGNQYEKEFSDGFRLTTNNRMELLAVIIGLETLKIQPMEVVVFSDSKYVIDAVEKKWVFNWEKKAFKDKKKPRPLETLSEYSQKASRKLSVDQRTQFTSTERKV